MTEQTDPSRSSQLLYVPSDGKGNYLMAYYRRADKFAVCGEWHQAAIFTDRTEAVQYLESLGDKKPQGWASIGLCEFEVYDKGLIEVERTATACDS